jgi:hypothetical protein
MGSRTRDFPACSTVPQALRYRVPPRILYIGFVNGIYILGWFRSVCTLLDEFQISETFISMKIVLLT